MIERFVDLFDDCTRQGTKIKTDEYQEAGKYIIVDQGQNDIAGYTDEISGVYEDIPAIVFGDHTRVIKYIDKPFFLGADGVKLLKCKRKNANYKYLYYALKNAKIPNTGYNRHYKWLKEIKIMYPNPIRQQRIVDVLDKIEKIMVYRKNQLEKLDELIKARFVEIFGDPYINPYGWKKLKVKNAVTVEPQNGLYKPQSDYVTDGTGTPILRIDGFYDGVVKSFSNLKRLNCEIGEKQRYLLYEDDVVINRVNSIEYLGKCAHIKGLLEDTVYESNMMRMHFDEKRFEPVYISKLLCSAFMYDQIVNHAKKAVNQASINQKDVLDFDIYQPPLELQNQFAAFVYQVDKSKTTVQKSLDETQMLFDSLMQQYFG